MSSYRAQANHALYLARLLTAGWQRELAAANVPAAALAQAYEPAVCNHLASAYGWFLLEITQPEPAPEFPPRGCDQLPPPPAGRVLPGEVREFSRLEREGWLGEVLRDRRGTVGRGRSTGNLIGAEVATGPEDCAAWADRLQDLFDRMGDSLDEY